MPSIALERFYEVGAAAGEARLELNEAGDDVSVAKESLGDSILSVLRNLPLLRERENVQNYVKRISASNANVMGAFIEALRTEIPDSRFHSSSGNSLAYGDPGFSLRHLGLIDHVENIDGHKGGIPLDRRLLQRVDPDRLRFVDRYKAAQRQAAATSQHPGTAAPSATKTGGKEKREAQKPTPHPRRGLIKAGDSCSYMAWRFKETAKPGLMQANGGAQPTSGDYVEAAIRSRKLPDQPAAAAPSDERQPNHLPPEQSAEVIVILVKGASDLSSEQKRTWLAKAYLSELERNPGAGKDKSPQLTSWNRDIETLRIAMESSAPASSSGAFSQMDRTESSDSSKDAFSSWTRALRTIRKGLESLASPSSTGARAQYLSSMKDSGYFGKLHETLCSKLGPEAIDIGVSTIKLHSNLDPETARRIAFARDAVTEDRRVPLSRKENNVLVGCSKGAYSDPGEHQACSNQVSIEMTVPLLRDDGTIVRPTLLAVAPPNLESIEQPDWDVYTAVDKDNTVTLDEKKCGLAITTLCDHIQACAAQHPEKRIVLDTFGQGAALDGLDEQGQLAAKKLYSDQTFQLVSKLRQQGRVVAFTDISDALLDRINDGFPPQDGIAIFGKSFLSSEVTDNDLIVNGTPPNSCIGNRGALDDSLNGQIGSRSLAHDIHAQACRIHNAAASEQVSRRPMDSRPVGHPAPNGNSAVPAPHYNNDIAPADGPPSAAVSQTEPALDPAADEIQSAASGAPQAAAHASITKADVSAPANLEQKILDSAYKVWTLGSLATAVYDFMGIGKATAVTASQLAIFAVPFTAVPALIESAVAVRLFQKEIAQKGKSLPQRAIYFVRDGAIQAVLAAV